MLPRVLYCIREVSFSAAIAFWNWIQRGRVGDVDIWRMFLVSLRRRAMAFPEKALVESFRGRSGSVAR